MKFLVLLFLVGFAAASVHDALDDANEEFYRDLMLGIQEDSLMESLGFPNHPDLIQAEDDDKKDVAKVLRDRMDEILEKMKDALDKGKMYKEDLQKKFDEMVAKMKEMKIDLGDKVKEMIDKVKQRIRDLIRNILDKIKVDKDKEERSVEQLAEFNMRDLFKRLKKQLLEKIDKEKMKAKIEEIFGKGSEMADSLLELVNKKGEKYKQKLLDLVDRFLGKDEDKRSIKEMWDKVKDYFKNLNIDLKEKYMKFGEWVKEVIDKSLEKGKSKVENIRNIAREFRDHAKNVSKEVAVEALEFLKPYKEDLGDLWNQVKDTVKDIVNRKD